MSRQLCAALKNVMLSQGTPQNSIGNYLGPYIHKGPFTDLKDSGSIRVGQQYYAKAKARAA